MKDSDEFEVRDERDLGDILVVRPNIGPEDFPKIVEAIGLLGYGITDYRKNPAVEMEE